MSFGQKLRETRKAKGLTQQAVAGMRFSAAYVSHLEHGKRAPSPEVAAYLEQRLGVEPGTLGVATIIPPQLHENRLVAMYEEARDLQVAGSHEDALPILATLIDSASATGKADLRWLGETARVEALQELARFDDAARSAGELRAIAKRSADPGLIIRAGALSANMERLRGDFKAAVEHATVAIGAAQADGISPNLHALALTAGISAAAGDERTVAWQQTLQVILPALSDDVRRAKATWALGAAAYQRGDSARGRHWQEETLKLLSPRSDVRAWVTFPRAAADFRIRAGETDGVPELLKLARERLTVLNSHDEVAAQTLIEAQYLTLIGEISQAKEALREADTSDLPPLSEARLRMQLARVCEAEGEVHQARGAALVSARLFNQAGATQEANEAWRLLEETGGLPGV